MTVRTWGQHWWYFVALAVMALHLLFNFWYVFGAAVTKGHARLERLHLLTLLYGVIAENCKFACPLTLLEQYCQARAGVEPYRGSFTIHYLHVLVAPNFPLWLLQFGAIGVFVVNLAIYVRRFALRYADSRRRMAERLLTGSRSR